MKVIIKICVIMRYGFLVVLMMAGVVRADDQDIAALLRELASSDRYARLAAAEKLNANATLPETAAKPIIDFIKLEVRLSRGVISARLALSTR
jgi:hypothetical protein